MAMDLLDKPTLQNKMACKLLAEAKVVLRMVVHTWTIVFSPSVYTLLMGNSLENDEAWQCP